jgi:hypothetical protein
LLSSRQPTKNKPKNKIFRISLPPDNSNRKLAPNLDTLNLNVRGGGKSFNLTKLTLRAIAGIASFFGLSAFFFDII